MNDSTMFYIQCTTTYAYDYILWWKPGSIGYTYDLDQAGLYTKAEAMDIVSSMEYTAIWPEDIVRKAANLAVSIETLTKIANEGTLP